MTRLLECQERDAGKLREHVSHQAQIALFNRIESSVREYKQDLASEEHGIVPTWWTRVTGTHGGNSDYVLGVASRKMDEFLVEYLRVNESEC